MLSLKLQNRESFSYQTFIFIKITQSFQTIVCWAVYARKRSGERVDAVLYMRVCSAADNKFVGYKGTKSLSIDKHLHTKNILLWRVSGGYIFAVL